MPYAAYLQAYYNVDTQRFCDASGAALAIEQLPRITLTQQLYLNLILLKDDGSRFAYNDDDVLSWAADDDWDDASSVLLATADAHINADDDFAGAARFPGLGIVAIRVDADSANLQAALGTAEQIVVYGELKIYRPAAVNPYFIGQMEMRARNLVDHAGITPPPVPGSYYARSQIDALIAPAAPTTCLADDTLVAPAGRSRYLGDTAGGNVVLTLPAAGDADPTAELLIVKAAAANLLTVRPASTEAINAGPGDATLTGVGEYLWLLPVTGGWLQLNPTYIRA
jgi:hypothetical protein